MIIRTKCPSCGDTEDLDLPASQYENWRRGALIQNCFPELSADDRERLVSGMCPECWDKLFRRPAVEKTEWTTKELQEEFEVISFLAPFVQVVRKRDRVMGWMEFTHMPRKYFDFVPYDWGPEK